MRNIIIALALWVSAAMAQAQAQAAEAGPVAATADAYFSASGRDAGGHRIGVDCTLAKPCRSVDKALSFLAQNIARAGGAGGGSARNYSLLFDGAGGPFHLSRTALFTTAHTVDEGFTTTFDVYNGTRAEWSGGRDIAGTWRAVKLPNGTGAAACVSDALAASAPLTGANAKLYVGAMWVDGMRAQEVRNPRIGAPWRTMPGALGEIVGSSVATSPTATLTRGAAEIAISDLARVGMVGETIGFDAASPPFQLVRRYWIISKSAKTGAGTITLSSAPGGPPMRASADATLGVQDPVQSVNRGDRTRINGQNRFPYNATDFETAFNQTDVKAEVVTGVAGSNLIPVFTASAGIVTLNSRPLKPLPENGHSLRAGMGYRVWNRFEDLGAGGHAGEIYTDRTTGLIYYTPRPGETCEGINAAGRSIIPGPLETLLQISNSAHDISIAGGAAGVPVGNLVMRNIVLEHTNTSVFTGANDLGGASGGFTANDSAHFSALNWGVVTIGASNVTFDHVEITHMGGSAVATAWGSNHITIKNSKIHEAGGALWTAGLSVNNSDAFHFNADPDTVGTGDFGASTPSFNRARGVARADLTGAHDCCQTFTNNFAYDAGLVNIGAACIAISTWQGFRVTHNTVHECPTFGLTESSWGAVAGSVGSFGGGLTAPAAFDNDLSYNEIYNCGYETSLTGVRVPGSSMANDFGCLYLLATQDGPGDGSVPGLTISYNKIHDISAAAYQTVLTWKPVVRTHGYDAILDYHDGNNTHGVNEHHNLFYNAEKVGGLTPVPSRLSQHTGSLRSTFRNNIWAGVFPAGYTIYTDYAPRADVPPFGFLWRSNYNFACAKTCYVINLGNLYAFTGTSRSGASAPTCASGACSDGGIEWTFAGKVPGDPFQTETQNITAWEVIGAARPDFPQIGGTLTEYPQFSRMDYNLYSQTGHALEFYTRIGVPKTFADWRALGQDVHSLAGVTGPNFVDMAKGDFRFNATQKDPGVGVPCGGAGAGTVSPACGLGFEPWDYDAAGAR